MTHPSVPPSSPPRAIPLSPFADDHGSAPVALVEALDGVVSGRTSGREVLATLARSRLLIPIVAVLDEAGLGADGQPGDKESSMATVLVEREDGNRAMLAFTSTAAMAAWRPDARPAPVTGIQAAASAVAEAATALLVDSAGPTPFVVAGDDLRVLAQAQVRDVRGTAEQLRGVLGAALAELPGLLDAWLADATSTELVLAVDATLSEPAYRGLLKEVSARLQAAPGLSEILSGGLRITVVAPGEKRPDTPSLLHDPTHRLGQNGES